MASVNIRINSRDYQIACDDGQEEHLRTLADDIEDRVRSLLFTMGANPGEAVALLLVALTMADELFDNKKEIEELRQSGQASRITEMEAAMTETLEGIAQRIEKIADRIEVG